MKKVIIVACILAHAYVGAVEEKKGKAQIEAEHRQKQLEEFLAKKAPTDIAQYIGEFISHWELSSIFSLPGGFELLLSPDGKLLLIIEEFGEIIFYEISTKKLLKKVKVLNEQEIGKVIFDASGTIVVVINEEGNLLNIISVMNDTKPIVVPLENNGNVIAFNPRDDSEILCINPTTPLTVRDSGTGAIARKFEDGSQSSKFCFSPNGHQIILWGQNGMQPSVWNISEGKRVFELPPINDEDNQYNAFYSRDGKNILIMKYVQPYTDYPEIRLKRVTLFNAQNGKEILTKEFPDSPYVHSQFILFNEQSEIITLAAEQDRIAILNITTNTISYVSNFKNISAVSISKKERLVALGSYDDIVYIWNIDTKNVIQELKLKPTGLAITKVIFSDNGKTLATKSSGHSHNESVSIWRQVSYTEKIKEDQLKKRKLLTMNKFLKDLQLIALAARL